MSENTSRLTAALGDRYKIVRHLGEGGMATVFLAEDFKHHRNVAVKVLRPELAAVLGGERFVQEITTTANLQHPHILPLFDSGEADGFLYYVMPFIDGETLRQKLDRETQLGIDEAVKITVEVADALDYAHRQGIVHRDIKPENILLHDGRPMVADFGIALAVSAAAGGRMTETGLSLGTPHYMSPEQATAEKDLTARADVYSLGSVLYEMLTGEPPHIGNSAQAIIMKIVTDEARPVTELRKSVPPHVAAAVAKAVEKLPADRFESAAAFRDALGDPGFTLPSTRAAASVEREPSSSNNGLAVIFGVTTVIASLLAIWQFLQPDRPRPVTRYDMRLPEGQPIGGFFARITLTPDGSRLIYSSGSLGQASLWIRNRDQLEASSLPGTEGALSPFVSPDGSSVGFGVARSVKAVSLRGGPPITIADTLVGGAGATWSADGFVYSDGRGPTPLVRVPATGGGSPEWFTTLDTTAGETDHLFPQALPNGRGVLFTVGHSQQVTSTRDIAVASTETGRHKILVRGTYALYAKPGYLLYVTSDGTLMAAPFDQDAMEVTGDPVAMAGGITLRTIGIPDVAVADDGTLMYTVGGPGNAATGTPTWVDRSGASTPVAADWTSTAATLSISPDGSRLAVAIESTEEGASSSIWVRDLGRGTVSKLTFDGDLNQRPVWSADGSNVLYQSNRGGDLALFSKRADGTLAAELVLDRSGPVQEARVSRDRSWIVFREGGGNGSDLYARRIAGDTTPVAIATTEFQETSPALSPDSRWIAYVSNETGQPEVYVRPFPDVAEGKWLVSISGGQEPLWSRDGTELFYRNANHDMVSVAVDNSVAPPTGTQQILFSASAFAETVFHQAYDVTPDGTRFIMLKRAEGVSQEAHLIVVENFFEVLRETFGD